LRAADRPQEAKATIKYLDGRGHSSGIMVTASTIKETVQGHKTVNIVEQKSSLQQSQDLAKARGGSLLTCQEFIAALKADHKLFDQLEGKWFWLGGDPGTELSGFCEVDYKKNELVQILQIPIKEGHQLPKEWYLLPFDRTAYAWKGTDPLSMGIVRKSGSWRLSLCGLRLRTVVAPVVVYATDGHGTPDLRRK
jgi:hypothetical protein